jgi:outer membrane protein
VKDENGIPILNRTKTIIDQFSDNKGNSFGVQLSVPILMVFSSQTM